MLRILIAGCGYIGEAAADFFHSRGWGVEGWTASPKSAEHLATKPYLVRAVDITNQKAVSETRDDFDVVLQCASTRGGSAEEYRRVYLEGARNLRYVFGGASHIFTSSTSVYGQRQGEVVDELSPAVPEHEKGRILRETEELVLGQSGIVARVAGIYGPGRSHLARTVLAGKRFVGQGRDRFINQAHRDDIVRALFVLADRREQVRGQIYNVVDDQPILASAAEEWLVTHLGRSSSTLEPASDGRRAETNKRVSNAKLRAVGWEPRYPNFQAGMLESVLPSFGIGG